MRINSETFCKWIAVELKSDLNKSLHVPKGCANAWLTTSEQTVVHYYMSTAYSSKHARGFKFNDKTFAVTWPNDPEVVSDKDKSWENFDKKVDGIEL